MLMFAGELLPDWCDDWLVVDREQRHQMRLHALEQLSDRLAAAGRPPRAAGLCGHCCNSRRLDVIQCKDSPFRVGRDRGGRRVIHSADPHGNDHARGEVR